MTNERGSTKMAVILLLGTLVGVLLFAFLLYVGFLALLPLGWYLDTNNTIPVPTWNELAMICSIYI